MTTLTDKMEGLREEDVVPDESGYGAFESGFNDCLDKCIALAEAEATVVGDWEGEFDKLYKTLGYKDELSFEEIPPDVQLKQFITTLLTAKDREIEEVINQIVKVSDKLESDCNNDKLGDKGMEQWKAFKGFRNTIRDRHLPDRPINSERE